MECKLEILVTPNSTKRGIVRDEKGIRAYVSSPPQDGKANEECIALFSKKLRVPKSMISIVKGSKEKRKILFVRGISYEEALIRLGEGNAK
ncbi:MAG: DUF167 domain-containing protein [Spirochaetes bacterium]|nr:DUF167 domain-containing protein [Spirochaetota bacterium]